MKALRQEYRNGASAMSREMERMIPTAFSVATMVRETMHSSP